MKRVVKKKVNHQIALTWWLFAVAVLSIILHNALSALLNAEEIIFFFASLLTMFLFFLSLGYNLYTYIRRGQPRDLWQLGFLGLLGLLGLVSSTGFFGFFGFFGLFGLRRK